MSDVTAILVAAGSSRRMGFDKLAAMIDGRPVLAHTVEVFLKCEAVKEIILVAPEGRMGLLDDLELNKPLVRVDGGSERHLSVSRGLAAVCDETKWIAVHDAARPYVTQEDILSAIGAAREFGAASLARRVTETLKRANEDDLICGAVDRENLWMIETPQVFGAACLREAYRMVLEKGMVVTDETSAMEVIGQEVKLVTSTSPNPKITTPADLK